MDVGKCSIVVKSARSLLDLGLADILNSNPPSPRGSAPALAYGRVLGIEVGLLPLQGCPLLFFDWPGSDRRRAWLGFCLAGLACFDAASSACDASACEGGEVADKDFVEVAEGDDDDSPTLPTPSPVPSPVCKSAAEAAKRCRCCFCLCFCCCWRRRPFSSSARSTNERASLACAPSTESPSSSAFSASPASTARHTLATLHAVASPAAVTSCASFAAFSAAACSSAAAAFAAATRLAEREGGALLSLLCLSRLCSCCLSRRTRRFSVRSSARDKTGAGGCCSSALLLAEASSSSLPTPPLAAALPASPSAPAAAPPGKPLSNWSSVAVWAKVDDGGDGDDGGGDESARNSRTRAAWLSAREEGTSPATRSFPRKSRERRPRSLATTDTTSSTQHASWAPLKSSARTHSSHPPPTTPSLSS
mmetsp:Transcript_47655/g.94531  ORF Transcript_47655/g.94531 Transcript_47655/m.94531 type:complete len:421 (+) Transcript_47655:62-1324(+)